jgi:hypothetical protein
MTTQQTIKLARKHLTDNNSARFCMANAIEKYDDGDYDAAQMWAKKSLAYSIGVFHKDYLKVS